ncbi:hypothetical protein PG984_004476 [Apiospora sp. TS-2023a]
MQHSVSPSCDPLALSRNQFLGTKSVAAVSRESPRKLVVELPQHQTVDDDLLGHVDPEGIEALVGAFADLQAKLQRLESLALAQHLDGAAYLGPEPRDFARAVRRGARDDERHVSQPFGGAARQRAQRARRLAVGRGCQRPHP